VTRSNECRKRSFLRRRNLEGEKRYHVRARSTLKTTETTLNKGSRWFSPCAAARIDSRDSHNGEVIPVAVVKRGEFTPQVTLRDCRVEHDSSLLQTAIRPVSRSRLSRGVRAAENFNGCWLLCSYRVMLNLCLVTACLDKRRGTEVMSKRKK